MKKHSSFGLLVIFHILLRVQKSHSFTSSADDGCFLARRRVASVASLLNIQRGALFSQSKSLPWHSPFCCASHSLLENNDDPLKNHPIRMTDISLDYFNAIRPVTVLQAVGALLVGWLALGQKHPVVQQPGRRLLAAAMSVYLSYGAGMVMNDIVDVNADSLHATKGGRALASGRISRRAGVMYCGVLGAASLALGSRVNWHYALWTGSNLVVMIGYAMGLQRVFLLKNAVCGWLAVSPLVGAALLSGGGASHQLVKLAAAGFPLHVAREIVKDIEDVDVDVDRGTKLTLPLVLGERAAHRIAYGMVAAVCSLVTLTPFYWEIFASSRYPIYPVGLAMGVPMCMRASFLPLSEGQRLLKKSIYVLLAGMIGGLLSQ